MKSVLKFLRDWTLPVSMLFGTLMYLLFAYTPALEEAAVFFDPIFELILPWFMFLVLWLDHSLSTTSIILIDEVLSVGDEKFRKKSYKKLRELIEDNSHTVIFVSHSLDKVKLLCDRVIWMDEGKIRRSGNPKAVVAEYEETEI